MAVYLVVSIVYIGFWLALSILCSVLFRGMATSALATLALWIFFAFFMALGARLAADVIAPLPTGASMNAEAVLRTIRCGPSSQWWSPITLYSEATGIVLDPLRRRRGHWS